MDARERLVTGEKTVAELSRELAIAPSVIRSWKRFAEAGAATTAQAHEDVVPASHLREAYAKIRDLERALGRKTMEVEILRAAQEVVKNEIERRGMSLWPTIVSLKSRLGSTRRAIGGNLATKRGSSSILEIVALSPASRAFQ